LAATVAKFTQSTAAVLREFQWQEDATGNTKVAESFRDQVTAGSSRLCVFIYMIEGSALVNFLHSVAKYYDIESGADVNNKFVAFIGDRTKKRDPNPAILQSQNAWVWKEFNVSLDPAVAEAWYNDPNNAKTLWRQPQATVKQWFPRMLFLPTLLVAFVVEKRRTPWEIHQEVVRLVEAGTNGLTLENTKLVREWCLAAGQCTSATECTPAIKMDVIAIASTCERFGDWCEKKVEATLGPRPDEGSSPSSNIGDGATISFATETNGAAQATPAPSWAASIDRMAQAVLKMSEKQIKLTEQPDARADKADKKVFTTYSLHALMGWSGVTQENMIAPLWAKFLTTKSYDDHRLNIHRAMKVMARQKEMEYEHNIYFTDKMIKAIISMAPNAGDGIATFESAAKALSILQCRPNSANEVEEIKRREKAEKETRTGRSYTEAMQLEEGDMRAPAVTYRELRVCVSSFGLLCYVIYGVDCDFAIKVHEIYKTLLLPKVLNQERYFTPELCKQITWAIHEEKCEFFSTRLHPDDFGPGKTPQFPVSDLDEILYHVKHLSPILRKSFPDAWKDTVYAQAGTMAATLPPITFQPQPTVPQPTFYQPLTLPTSTTASGGGSTSHQQAPNTMSNALKKKLAHLHSGIATFLRPFHIKFNGRVMLTKVLRIAKSEWSQLPTIKKYLDVTNNVNNLCYNHVLGHCPGKRCNRSHATKDEVTESFVLQICQLIQPGVEWMLQNEPAAPGTDHFQTGGKRSGTGPDGPAQKQFKGGPDNA
jgi:hypothetical protein